MDCQSLLSGPLPASKLCIFTSDNKSVNCPFLPWLSVSLRCLNSLLQQFNSGADRITEIWKCIYCFAWNYRVNIRNTSQVNSNTMHSLWSSKIKLKQFVNMTSIKEGLARLLDLTALNINSFSLSFLFFSIHCQLSLQRPPDNQWMFSSEPLHLCCQVSAKVTFIWWEIENDGEQDETPLIVVCMKYVEVG